MMNVILISFAYFISMLVIYILDFMGKTKPNVKIEVSGSLEIGPTLGGYLLDNSEKNFRLLFVNVLELVKKGYISMEVKKENGQVVDYLFTKIKDKEDINKLKNYEIMAYNFLFINDKKKASLNEILELISTKDSIKAQAKLSTLYAHKEAVQNELEIQEYTINKSDRLKSVHQIYFITGCIFTVISAIFLNLLLVITFVAWTIFISVFFTYISNDLNYTQKGVNERERALKYRKYIKASLSNPSVTQKLDILDDVCIYAIALGIDIGNVASISDYAKHELKEKNASKKIIYANDLYTVYYIKIALAFSLTLLIVIMLNLISLIMNLY